MVEYVRSIYRGDRYRLVSELGRRAGDGAEPRSLDPSTYQAVVRPMGEFGEIGLDKLASDMPRSQT
jgi:hypothetical protein